MIAQVLTHAGLVLVAVALLWKGADWVVEAACRIARHFAISDLVIGATVVALGTSAPEVVVTLVAAFTGHPDVSVGNVVGSNIFNVGVILGLCAAVWRIPTNSSLVTLHAPVLLGSCVLLTIFLLDRELSRIEGGLMVIALAGYIVYLVRRTDDEFEEEEIPAEPARSRDYGVLLAGLGAVLYGAHLLVNSAVSVGHLIGASEWAIAVTVVAGGTSLPELATAIAAGRRGRTGLMAGALIGSDIFNVLGVLGLAAMLHPLAIAQQAMPSIVMMTAMVVLLIVFMRTNWQLSRTEGVILVLLAIARWGRDLGVVG